MTTIPPKKTRPKWTEKRKTAVLAGLELERQIRELEQTGLEKTAICAQLSISPGSYKHIHARLHRRIDGAMDRVATIAAQRNYQRLDAMAETATDRREGDDGYRWIRAGVDAMDVMGKQLGLGKSGDAVSVVITINVPVLGPAQAARPGEIIDGTVLRVINDGKDDTPPGSLKAIG